MAGQPVAPVHPARRGVGTAARRGRGAPRRAVASLLAAGCLALTTAVPAHAAPTSGTGQPGAVGVPDTATPPWAGVTPQASGANGTDGASGYRFWSFWTQADGAGDWEYATQGPGTLRPPDGSAVGFRFAVSANSGDEGAPRTAPAFDEVCGAADDAGDDTAGDAGEARRVALVLDYGTAEDAPDGAEPPTSRTVCADVPEGGTVADVLAAEAEPLRYNNAGLLCAIDGYPAEGCGEETGGASEETDDTEDERTDTALGDGSGDGSLGVWLGLAAVAVLAAAALGRSRRRSGA